MQKWNGRGFFARHTTGSDVSVHPFEEQLELELGQVI